MKKLILLSFIILTVFGQTFSAITPNPKLSDGKTVYTSKGNAAYLVDNKFNTSSWLSAVDSWIAIPVDSGTSKIFFNWNCPYYAWSNELSPSNCPNSNAYPIDYDLLVSANSTNGADGDWTIADSIRGNIVCSRGHLVNFSGSKWVKMHIIKGKGQIDEIQVYNVSNGGEDTWLFAGTSITANTFKGTPPAKNYADLITGKHPAYAPAIIRGGIGCISSTDFVKNLSSYLKMAGNAHYWAIEMGTNDAWGGTNGNVATFKNNLQIVIDSCKARGIQPIIARVLATNSTFANWQVHPDFLKAVDDLTASNNLIPGPDLYSWFIANPGDLNNDGVHPSAIGAASIQRLWAEKMDSLYGGCNSTQIVPSIKVNQGNSTMLSSATAYSGDTVTLSPTAGSNGTWMWSGPANYSSSTREIILNTIQIAQGGSYVVTYTNSNSCASSYTFKITVKEKVGISNSDLGSKISVYPNPAHNGNLTVLVNDLKDGAQIQIVDINGKLVFSTPITQKESEISTGLAKGNYVVKVVNQQDSLNQKLVIE